MIKLYTSILQSYGLAIDDKGVVLLGEKPLTVGGKPLAIPTKGILENLMGPKDGSKTLETKYTLFNPLYENMVSTRNVLMEAFTKLSNIHVSTFIGTVMIDLMEELRTDNKDPLLVDLAVRCSAVKGTSKDLWSESTISKLTSIITKDIGGKRGMIKLFIKRAMVHKGEEYSRVLLASYKFMDMDKDALEKETGVKLSRKEYDLFMILYKDIIENVTDTDKVLMTSNDTLAPAASVLFRGYHLMIDNLNKYVKSYGLTTEYMTCTYSIDSFIDMKAKYGAELASIVKVDDTGNIISTGGVDEVMKPKNPVDAMSNNYHENYIRPDQSGNTTIANGTPGTEVQPANTGPSELDLLDMMVGVKSIPGMANQQQRFNPFANQQPVQQLNPFANQQQQFNPFANQQPTGNVVQQQPAVIPGYNFMGIDPNTNKPVYQAIYAEPNPVHTQAPGGWM